MAHTDTPITVNALAASILHDCGFGRVCLVNAQHARQLATEHAPACLWARDGWYTVCQMPPDDMPIDPTRYGWALVEVVYAP